MNSSPNMNDLDRLMSSLQTLGFVRMNLSTGDDLRSAMAKVNSMANTLAVELDVKQGIHGWDIWVVGVEE